MAGYKADTIIKQGVPQSVAASQTDASVSNEFVIRADGGVKGLRIDILVSAATAATGITAKLQHAVSPQLTPSFEDVDTAEGKVAITTVATPTWFSIRMFGSVAAQAALMPLRPHGRVVVTTGAGDSVAISALRLTQVD